MKQNIMSLVQAAHHAEHQYELPVQAVSETPQHLFYHVSPKAMDLAHHLFCILRTRNGLQAFSGSSKIQVGKQNLLTLEKSNFPVIR